MEQSDEILVARAQTGDSAAFAQLVERHYDLVFRLGYRLLGDQTQAQDLTQDICTKLPQKLAGFRAEAKFSTWLYRITLNAAKDMLRAQVSRRNAQKTWGEITNLQHDNTKQRNAELEWLEQAMNLLPDDLRETVVLILSEDLTHAQASAVLGVSEGTVSWRMHEVKKHLRELAKAEETYP